MLFIAKSINSSNFMAKPMNQTFSLPNQLNIFYLMDFTMRKTILHNVCFIHQYSAVDILFQIKNGCNKIDIATMELVIFCFEGE